VARGLSALGLARGDAIGMIGYSFGAYFARLAGVRIVAEIPAYAAPAFWQADTATRAGTLDAFRRAGVRMVVADHAPPRLAASGWQRVGRTGHFVYRVPE
jgi:hypothetical protein